MSIKADGDFEFLVDMSGAIGFTDETPQFSIGTISTLEAGVSGNGYHIGGWSGRH